MQAMNGPTFAQPQTAARPAAAPPGRPAAPARTARPAPDAGGFPIFTWLRLHWLKIVFCGALLGGALAYLAWVLLPSEFESYALLRVMSSPPSIANQKDPNRNKTDFATALKTNRQIIKSEFVLNRALGYPQSGNPNDKSGPKIVDLPTLKDQREPIKYLTEKLLVEGNDGSELITIMLKGHQPADIQKVVNAVQAAFMEEVIEKETMERADLVQKVERALVKLTEELNRKQSKPDGGDPGLGLPVAPPAGALGPNLQLPNALAAGPPESVKKAFTQLLIAKVGALQHQAEELPLQIQSQEERVKALKLQIEALQKLPPSKETVAAVDSDPEVHQLTMAAMTMRRKYEHEKAIYQNPNAEVLNGSRIAAEQAEAHVAKLKEKKIHDRELAKRQAKADDLYPKFVEADRALSELKERLRVVTQLLKDKREEVAKLPPDPVKEGEKKDGEKKKPTIDPAITELIGEDEVFKSMSINAALLRLDQDAPNRVRVLQTASTPIQKDTKKQVLGTVFAGLMGFVLVALGAVGYEVRVKKVSSLAELQTATGTPVVGVIPWQPGAAGVAD